MIVFLPDNSNQSDTSLFLPILNPTPLPKLTLSLSFARKLSHIRQDRYKDQGTICDVVVDM
jgi:hypothetical protein